jgi:putative ABC transport system substrate-binding protein
VTRRAFITLLGGTAAAWPLAARAQQRAVPVIGYLHGSSADAVAHLTAAFRRGLSDGGLIEERNVIIEYRWAEGQYERLPALAAELVRGQVAVIVAGTPVAALAAKRATTSIPIVFVLGSDPVRDGLVVSLNRPGGNITGATFFSNLLNAKRLQFLHQVVPDARTIAVLLNPKNANVESEQSETQEAARALGLQLVLLHASNAQEIDAAFVRLAEPRGAALLVSGDALFNRQRRQIGERSVRYSIATSGPTRDQAIAGSLMSYGARYDETYRQAGNYVGRVLKGEKPADLPVMQPTKFEFVINLKTARALGLDVPATLLATADEVIE